MGKTKKENEFGIEFHPKMPESTRLYLLEQFEKKKNLPPISLTEEKDPLFKTKEEADEFLEVALSVWKPQVDHQ